MHEGKNPAGALMSTAPVTVVAVHEALTHSSNATLGVDLQPRRRARVERRGSERPGEDASARHLRIWRRTHRAIQRQRDKMGGGAAAHDTPVDHAAGSHHKRSQ